MGERERAAGYTKAQVLLPGRRRIVCGSRDGCACIRMAVFKFQPTCWYQHTGTQCPAISVLLLLRKL